MTELESTPRGYCGHCHQETPWRAGTGTAWLSWLCCRCGFQTASVRSELDIADDEYDRRPRDFSHLTAEQHEEMRQNDATGEHGRWEDDGHEHDREVEEASVSTPETPRTWTLYEHKAFHGTEARGPDLASSIEDDPPAPIEVVEKAPVDAERERLLDLLEERHDSPDWDLDVSSRVVAVLREYGRLGKEES